MSTQAPKLVVLAFALLAISCSTIPSGPAVAVIPGSGKSLARFQSDDAECRRFANQQVSGVTPNDAATKSAVTSATVGTAVGAAAGAAFGAGEGAAVGAGTGLLAGTMYGLGSGSHAAGVVQARYDNAYSQCMVTQGNRVPDYDRYAAAPPRIVEQPLPPSDYEPYPEGYEEAPPPRMYGPPPVVYGPPAYGPPMYGPPIVYGPPVYGPAFVYGPPLPYYGCHGPYGHGYHHPHTSFGFYAY